MTDEPCAKKDSLNSPLSSAPGSVEEAITDLRHRWVTYRSQRPRSFTGEMVDEVALEREDQLMDVFLRDLDTLIVALQASSPSGSADNCEWLYQKDDGVWRSHCGMYWNFDDGNSPASHDVHFCGKCGKKLVVKASSPSPSDRKDK